MKKLILMISFTLLTGCGKNAAPTTLPIDPSSGNGIAFTDTTCAVIDVCTYPTNNTNVECRESVYMKGIGEGNKVPSNIYGEKPCLITKEDYTVVQGPGPAAPKF